MGSIHNQRNALKTWVDQRFGQIHTTWKETGPVPPDWTKRKQLQTMLSYLQDGAQVMVTRMERLDCHMKRLGRCLAELGRRGATLHILDFGSQQLSLPPNTLVTFDRLFGVTWQIQQAYLASQRKQSRKPLEDGDDTESFAENDLGRLRYVYYQVRVKGRPFRDVMQQAYDEQWRMADNTAWVYKREFKRPPKRSCMYQMLRRFERLRAKECRRLREIPSDILERVWV